VTSYASPWTATRSPCSDPDLTIVSGKPRKPETQSVANRGPAAAEPAVDESARLPGTADDAGGHVTDESRHELELVLATLGLAAGAKAARVTVCGRSVAEWVADEEGGSVPNTPVSSIVGAHDEGRHPPAGRRIREALRTRHVEDAEVELDLAANAGAMRPETAVVDALVVAASRILDCDAMEVGLATGTTQREHFLVALQHELRTPATALMLEAGLLQSGLLGNLPPRVHSTIERLERQVGDFLRVVQRVLDLAQVENLADGRADLVDVRRAIVAIARNAEPEAARKGVAFSLFFPRTIPAIQTDEDRFRRVVNHLLANAVKYSGAGRVQIRVEREAGSAGVPEILVRIADCGPGIPSDELERVFEPFAQVEEGARTDSRHRGIGLGLSIARRLARSIGGEVTVESVVGTGTTATFSLPLGQERVH
jgi:signal transduction histidine kinase